MTVITEVEARSLLTRIVKYGEPNELARMYSLITATPVQVKSSTTVSDEWSSGLQTGRVEPTIK